MAAPSVPLSYCNANWTDCGRECLNHGSPTVGEARGGLDQKGGDQKNGDQTIAGQTTGGQTTGGQTTADLAEMEPGAAPKDGGRRSVGAMVAGHPIPNGTIICSEPSSICVLLAWMGRPSVWNVVSRRGGGMASVESATSQNAPTDRMAPFLSRRSMLANPIVRIHQSVTIPTNRRSPTWTSA